MMEKSINVYNRNCDQSTPDISERAMLKHPADDLRVLFLLHSRHCFHGGVNRIQASFMRGRIYSYPASSKAFFVDKNWIIMGGRDSGQFADTIDSVPPIFPQPSLRTRIDLYPQHQ